MTTVNTKTTPTTGNPGNLPTIPAFTAFSHIIRSRVAPAPQKLGGMERQQAIENALSMALHYIRTTNNQQGIQAATAKAIRAATMLKQACAESTIGGVAA